MNLIALKNKYWNFEGIVILSFASVFFPYYLTALIVIGLGFYILFNRNLRSLAFSKNYSVFFIAFTIYSIFIGIINLNILGILCSLFFFLVFVVASYFKEVVNNNLYEKGLNATIFSACIVSILTIIDFLIFHKSTTRIYRATLFFFNPNYLATLMSIVVIICAYKVITKKGLSILYYICACFAGVAIYLTGSLFALVEVFIGVATILLLCRRHQILSIFLLLAATFLIILYCSPDILPRLAQADRTTENRIKIWQTSFEAIKGSPLFGKGYLTYYHNLKFYPNAYATTHAHNLILEPLLSFGVIGTALFSLFLTFYYKNVSVCKNYQSKSLISSLILAVTAAALVHATTDMTLIWIQTGFLFALILSGLGYEERLLKI